MSTDPIAPPPDLTIGMAVYDDFDGVYFTVQAIRAFHREVAARVRFLVLDNNPGGNHSKDIREFVDGSAGGRYLPVGDIRGTAVRDRLFREADTPLVLCVDSHILIEPGGIARLLAYYDAHPDTHDLIQGPLRGDDCNDLASHFSPGWREGMYGTWDRDPRTGDVDGPPFEIPMQGLGLFSCRRAAWLGFNQRFRGFGGEEGYIHEKFRRAGQRCLCLPGLRWIHRFRRPDGPKYPNRWEDRVRNYLIGWREVGMDEAAIVEHFAGRIGADAVAAVVAALDAEDAAIARGEASASDDKAPEALASPLLTPAVHVGSGACAIESGGWAVQWRGWFAPIDVVLVRARYQSTAPEMLHEVPVKDAALCGQIASALTAVDRGYFELKPTAQVHARFATIPIGPDAGTPWRLDAGPGPEPEARLSFVVWLGDSGAAMIDLGPNGHVLPATGSLVVFPASLSHRVVAAGNVGAAICGFL